MNAGLMLPAAVRTEVPPLPSRGANAASDARLAPGSSAAGRGGSWGDQLSGWLTGSAAACGRGLPLDPHDVDIMIDHSDVQAVANLFADVRIEPLVDTGGWLTRDFGVPFVHARIDVASNPSERLDGPEPADCGPYAQSHMETVQYRGHAIKVPPLHLQMAADLRCARTARARLVQRHLRPVPPASTRPQPSLPEEPR